MNGHNVWHVLSGQNYKGHFAQAFLAPPLPWLFHGDGIALTRRNLTRQEREMELEMAKGEKTSPFVDPLYLSSASAHFHHMRRLRGESKPREETEPFFAEDSAISAYVRNPFSLFSRFFSSQRHSPRLLLVEPLERKIRVPPPEINPPRQSEGEGRGRERAFPALPLLAQLAGGEIFYNYVA